MKAVTNERPTFVKNIIIFGNSIFFIVVDFLSNLKFILVLN
jgi:hypothetical protein